MINKKEIGQKIHIARINAGITQEQLAEYVGISANYLSKLERGLNTPSAENFLKFIQILNLTLDDFGINISPKVNVHKKKILELLDSCDNRILEILAPILEVIVASLKSKK